MGTRRLAWLGWVAVCLLWLASARCATAQPAPPDVAARSDRDHVVVALEISGAITHQTEELLAQALREGEARRARAVLIVLDTPGGLLDATRVMVQKILEAPLPVLTLVAPAGARA